MMFCAPEVTYRAAEAWRALLSARSLVIPLTFRDHACWTLTSIALLRARGASRLHAEPFAVSTA